MKRKKKPDDKAAATIVANSTDNRQSPGRPPPDDAKWLAGDTWSETELDALTTEFAEQAKPLDTEDRGECPAVFLRICRCETVQAP